MKRNINIERISKIIRQYNLKPKKSFGQNFLVNMNLVDRIISSMGELANHDILEIGPGAGVLTRELLSRGARKVIAIEKDAQFLDPLKDIGRAHPNKLVLINQDFFEVNTKLLLKKPVKIVSNLPYNIGTQILLQFITSKSWPPFWDSLTLMFQQEVAARITSTPYNKSYGRLSIISQWRSEIKTLFNVDAESFIPVPKVKSTVLQFTPILKPLFVAHQGTLEHIVKVAFSQRRKMLRQCLKSVHEEIEKVLISLEIDPKSRAEEISVEQFCKLANILNSSKCDKKS